MNNCYNTIFFDLDDTLLDYTFDEKNCIKKVLENHGVLPEDAVFDIYYGCENWQAYTMGEVTPKAVITYRFAQVLKIIGVDNADAMADEFYCLMQNSHTLKKGVLKTLETLKKSSYKMYITSNGYSQFQRKRIVDAGLEKYFNGIFISEEINRKKPGKPFFDYVLHRIPQSNIKKILLVGDAPTSDILGGINAGIDTCWLDDKNKKCRHKYTYSIKNVAELLDLL